MKARIRGHELLRAYNQWEDDDFVEVEVDPIEEEWKHVNPNCKDPSRCLPHGETGPVAYRPPQKIEELDSEKYLHDQDDLIEKINELIREHNKRV